MRFSWQKLALLILLLLLVFGFLMIFGFNFTGVGGEIKIIKNDHLTTPGATSEFTFVPDLDDLGGLVLYFDKFYYVEGEKNGALNFSLEYTDHDGKIVNRNQTIKIKTLTNGDRKVLFAPLLKSSGQEVTVKITADEETKILADPGLELILTDVNPDEFVNTAPRPIYHFSSRKIIGKIYRRFLLDKKFALLYLSFLSVTILAILILATFDFDPKRRSAVNK